MTEVVYAAGTDDIVASSPPWSGMVNVSHLGGYAETWANHDGSNDGSWAVIPMGHYGDPSILLERELLGLGIRFVYGINRATDGTQGPVPACGGGITYGLETALSKDGITPLKSFFWDYCNVGGAVEFGGEGEFHDTTWALTDYYDQEDYPLYVMVRLPTQLGTEDVINGYDRSIKHVYVVAYVSDEEPTPNPISIVEYEGNSQGEVFLRWTE